MEHTDRLKILYCKSRDFRFQDEKLPTMEEIEEHWQELPEWVVENLVEDGMNFLNPLEEIYRRMNNYNTNPLAVEFHHKNRDEGWFSAPENSRIGQEWLKENGVGHTSMSVGDIIVVIDPEYNYWNFNDGWSDQSKNGYYYCMSIGFERIHNIGIRSKDGTQTYLVDSPGWWEKPLIEGKTPNELMNTDEWHHA
tara:strand:- start:9916 stop:10497 length:582 start_codon:yes stop_codon:yes gene_type:complete